MGYRADPTTCDEGPRYDVGRGGGPREAKWKAIGPVSPIESERHISQASIDTGWTPNPPGGVVEVHRIPSMRLLCEASAGRSEAITSSEVTDSMAAEDGAMG